jgi:hypothetical protein
VESDELQSLLDVWPFHLLLPAEHAAGGH